jgi:AcrR family transcriptional regulator
MGAMEASPQTRPIDGEKAQRIVAAMRDSVGSRGVAGSTFDHVAREAGVSRGLLHYYFGTKERLLGEVVRRDCDVRMTVLDEQLASASTADDFVAMLATSLKQMLSDDPDFITLIFELFILARRNEEIAGEFTELLRRTREHVGGLLAAKQEEGVLHLRGEPEAVADVLFALADGLAMRMLSDSRHDFGPTVAAAVTAARALLDDR